MSRTVLGVSALGVLLLALVVWQVSTPLVVKIPRAEIQELLDQRFPRSKEIPFLFRVELRDPVIELRKNPDRLYVEVTAETDRKVGSRRLSAALGVSGALRYVDRRGEFHLDDPEVEKFSILSLSEGQNARARSGLDWVASQLLGSIPIYRLKERRWTQALVRYVLRDVRIERGELVATLAPGGIRLPASD